MSISSASNRDAKNLPPIGHFKHQDSAKDSKKRRGGPGMGGGSVSGPAGAEARIQESQVRGQPAQFGNGSKVRFLPVTIRSRQSRLWILFS